MVIKDTDVWPLPVFVSERDLRLGARQLESRLWAGFSAKSLHLLERVAEDKSVSRTERSSANLAIARWHLANDDFDTALRYANRARTASVRSLLNRKHALIEAWCLSTLGQGARARRALAVQRLFGSGNPAVTLAIANTFAPSSGTHSDEARLDWINRLYRKAGAAGLRRADNSKPLTFDNLSADPSQAVDAPVKVSVLMPTYNCASTVSTALESLLAQTWTNLEIIVADDASTDETARVVQSLAARDGRIRYIRLPKNQGAYMARNAALQVAQGEFVTTHDTDDWSHPQKIQLQVQHLLDNQQDPCNFSYWARTDNDLFFLGKFRHRDELIHRNFSSFMFRRSVLMDLGGWDAIRVSGDSELVRRVQKAYPHRPPEGIEPSVPLSFSLVLSDSLTRAAATHGRTSWHGVRRCYSEAANFWLWHGSDFPRLEGFNGIRAFPAPSLILPDRTRELACDVLIVGDLAQDGPAAKQLSDQIAFFLEHGASVGLFHWGRFTADPNAPPCKEIQRLAHDEHVLIVPPGIGVTTKETFVLDPSLLSDRIDMPPRLSTSRLFLIGRPEDLPSPQAKALTDHVETLFGIAGVWAETVGAASDLGSSK